MGLSVAEHVCLVADAGLPSRAVPSANSSHLEPGANVCGLPGEAWQELEQTMRSGRALVLFPAADAKDVAHAAAELGEASHAAGEPFDLVVPDGTWAQAKRINRKLSHSATATRARRRISGGASGAEIEGWVAQERVYGAVRGAMQPAWTLCRGLARWWLDWRL